MTHVDIVVIGAGAAGLGAAKELQKLQAEFVVLEAAHRIGGRAYTENLAPGIPFDLGAHWIMAPSINPLMALADKQCLQPESADEHYTAARYFENSGWLPEDAFREFGNYWDQQFATLGRVAASNRVLSVFDAIDNESRWAPYLHMFFAQDYTRDVDQACARDAMAYVREEDDIAVLSGLGNLLAQFGSQVEVSLNSAVRKIDWDTRPIKLDTAKGRITADKVIVTVSTGVLASGAIEFFPPLPDSKRDAISGLPVGSCTRIGMLFDDAALRELPKKFTIDTSGDGPINFRNRLSGYEFVEVTTGGRMAEWMEKSGEAATIDFVLGKLRDVAGKQAVPSPKRAIVSAWDGDAWTRGAYSCARPGQSHQRQALARPIDHRLFFAGEATSADQYASVHGAMITGRESARLATT